MTELLDKDIKIETFTSGINCPVTMRLIHMPTGLVVNGEDKSRYRLTIKLKEELAALIEQEAAPEKVVTHWLENWQCLACDSSGQSRKAGVGVRGDCPILCSKCREPVCPICGGKIDPTKGLHEDVMDCGGGCVNCDWEHCALCI